MSDLSGRAGELSAEVTRLRESVDALREGLARTRRRWAGVASAIVLMIAIVVALGALAYRQLRTEDRIEALCPVLALVVGGANPESRPPGPARDQYVDAIEVMRGTYEGLGCSTSTPLVPPPARP